jgi:hypothetical protein
VGRKTERYIYKPYFPVTTKEKLKLIRMKFNTTTRGYAGQDIPGLYIPIDPKYIYAEANMVDRRYDRNRSYIDSNNSITGDGFEQLISQRQNLIFSNIEMLYTEIDKRQRIKDMNIYRINIDQCYFKNLIYQMNDNIWDKNRVELERKIIDLEQEKRKEEANCFKDTLFIQKDLRQSLVEKLEEQQKANLFLNQPEELACNA